MLGLLLGKQEVFSQRVVINQNGDKVVIYEDGSWRYYDPEIHQDLLGNAPESEDLPYVNISQEENDGIQGGTPQQRILRLAQESAVQESRILTELDEARLTAESLRADLKRAQTDPNTSLSELVNLEKEYETTQKQLSRKQDQYKAAVKRTKTLQRMLQLPEKKQEKALAKLENRRPVKKSRKKKQDPIRKTNAKPTETIAGVEPYQLSFEKVDVMLFPPDPPCPEIKTKMDEFSGNFVRYTSPEVLFYLYQRTTPPLF